ncbi:hypothetical protein Taro_029670 [Colocasia esculenta]|uniref:PHD-type domain-containing protein n=1 Tax=Colocasia esculenta TaxID=4460 RepID=A0A843VKE5_COLES|nr:hypothetical protein [Colocasia esculenta]
MPPSDPAAAAPEPFPANCTVRKRTKAPRPSEATKYRSLVEVMLAAKSVPPVTGDYYGDVRCEECRSGEGDEEILLCDRCDRGYHLYCLRPIVVRVPTGPWFCPSCAGDRHFREFPLLQTKILDFFRIQKCSSDAGDRKCMLLQVVVLVMMSHDTVVADCKRRKRRSLVMQKKRRRLLPFNPTEDPARRLEQMGSLATALTSLHMEFSNDLTYMPGMAPRTANRATLEDGGMQVLSKEDGEALEICRTMCKRGECPPLVVVFDSLEGFTVAADGFIKEMTFITEYTGDVDYIRNREDDDCDSMMTLLLATNTSDSLVICPDKRGNIARFINGINNHSP